MPVLPIVKLDGLPERPGSTVDVVVECLLVPGVGELDVVDVRQDVDHPAIERIRREVNGVPLMVGKQPLMTEVAGVIGGHVAGGSASPKVPALG